MANIAINGFGRIGRLFFRQAFGVKDMNIVAVNDLGDPENLAYLLTHDSVYGNWDKSVSVKHEKLVVGGQEVSCYQIRDPLELPWKKLGVDIVVEATGMFEEYEKARAHITAGAKRVVLTAPAKDADGTEGATILMGINEDTMDKVILTSNGSCTTNAAAPVIQILKETIGIKKAILNTVHGYTTSQNLVDGPSRGGDVRRGRAAAINIVPSTTGAALAVARAIPELEGVFDGIAIRVPVISGSLADITFVANKKTTVDEVNAVFKKAAGEPRWDGIFTVTDEPIVSSDIIGRPYGAIVDLSFTRVVDGDLVKVLSWYDNEAGYVATLVKHVLNVTALV